MTRKARKGQPKSAGQTVEPREERSEHVVVQDEDDQQSIPGDTIVEEETVIQQGTVPTSVRHDVITIEEKQYEMRTAGEPQRQMEADEFGGFVTGNRPMTEYPMQGHDIPQSVEPEVVQHTPQQHHPNHGQINNPGHRSVSNENNTGNVEETRPVNAQSQQPMLSGYGQVPQWTRPAQAPEGQPDQRYNIVGDTHTGYGPVFRRSSSVRQRPYIQPTSYSLADVLGQDMRNFQPTRAPISQEHMPAVRLTQPPHTTDGGGRNEANEMRYPPFNFPTERHGEFARNMSRISNNLTAAASGSNVYQTFLRNNLAEQLQLALAVQLGLNGPQLIKQHALLNVLTSKSARGDLQQVLQSRAEIYGDLLDPKWFGPAVDLASKTKDMVQSTKARSMLIGAPLLVAQLNALELRKRMMSGNIDALHQTRLGATMTVAQMLKILSDAPPLAVLTLINKKFGNWVSNNLLQQSNDLDFVQNVITAIGNYAEINPTMHAVLQGFNRRRHVGRFKVGSQDIEMDRLRFSHKASGKDSDVKQERTSKTTKSGGGSSPMCHFFQRQQGCRMTTRCKFEHKCMICGARSHGAFKCYSREANLQTSRSHRENRRARPESRANSVPPDPRRRRSRATNAEE